MRRKGLIVFSLILALIALFVTLQQPDQTESLSQPELQNDDWLLINSKTWQLQRDTPNEQQFLTAKLIRQQPQDLYIDNPEWWLIQNSHQTHVKSNHLHIQQQRLFYFTGQVEIETHQTNTDQNSRLQTNSILYNRPDELISTQDRVHLETPQTTTTAVGLRINLTQQHTQLLSEVKTVYVP